MKKMYNLNGVVYQEPLPIGFDISNAVEIISPIKEDGTLYTTHPDIAKVATKADNSFYKYYLTTADTKGIYQPDVLLEQAEIDTQALADFKSKVKSDLDETDKTVLRIQNAIVLGKTTQSTQDVIDFLTYIDDLRVLLSSTTIAALPIKPPYPKNT